MNDNELLDIYSDYLISAFGLTTATGLAELLDRAVSHNRVQRFLAGRELTSADLWRLVKPHVRAVQDDSGVLIVDASIAAKPYTDENDIVCWHYHHARDRTIKGINFLTVMYHAQGVSLPVGFALVAKTEHYLDKEGQPKRRSPISKNEYYQQLTHHAVTNQIPFKYVLNDVWYASADNMMFVKHTLHKEFIMPLKANRKMALSLVDKQAGRYVRVDTLALEPQTVREVYLEQVDVPLFLVKQIFENADGSTGRSIWSPATPPGPTTTSPRSIANDGPWSHITSRSSKMRRWKNRPPKPFGLRPITSSWPSVATSNSNC